MRGIAGALCRAAALILLLGGCTFQRAVEGGQFSSLTPKHNGVCMPVAALAGVEDLVIDRDTGTAFFSALERRTWRAYDDSSDPAGARNPAQGGIFAGPYNAPHVAPRLLTAPLVGGIKPHGISLYKATKGPKILGVISHPTRDTTEVLLYEVIDRPAVALKLRRRLIDLPSLNDLHMVGPEQFYATVDMGSESWLGQSLEMVFALPRSKVVYFDGHRYRDAWNGLRTANGIAGTAGNREIYVSETLGMNIRRFARDPISGALRLTDAQAGSGMPRTFFDNIDIDARGRLWVAAHPRILDFAAHAENPSMRSASKVFRFDRPLLPGSLTGTEVYANEGDEVSGASIAAVHNGRMLIGSVFEPYYLNCPEPQ